MFRRKHAEGDVEQAARRGPGMSGPMPVASRSVGAALEAIEENGPEALLAADVRHLQETAGNRAVAGLIGGKGAPVHPGGSAPTLQLLPKPVVQHARLRMLVNDLYKGAQMRNVIGDGSTADAIRREHRTGQPTRGVFHDEKGRQYIRALTNWLNKGGFKGGRNASPTDRQAARSLIADLQNALKS